MLANQMEYLKQLLNTVGTFFCTFCASFKHQYIYVFFFSNHIGNEKIVEHLVQNRANVNEVDILGETPLALAAYKG